MILWLVTKSAAALFAIGVIGLIQKASGADWFKAAVIYLVFWTVLYDGRVIADAYHQWNTQGKGGGE